MSWRLPLGMIAGRGSGVLPSDFWLDSQFDRRIVVSATNGQSIPLYDHLLDITVPASAGITSNTLRAVEVTAIDAIDRAYDWRYATATSSPNRLAFLPVCISGTTVTVKVLGKWAASETRYIALYWDSTNTVASTTYSHLDGIVQTWSYVVGGTVATNDVLKLICGGQTYTYTVIGGDTATSVATALKNLVNAGAVATATSSSGTITITQTSKLDGTFTVTSTGSTLTTTTITITKPTYFGIGRVGPDTDLFNATNFVAGLPYNTAGGIVSRPAFGRAGGTTRGLRNMSYTVNGTGTVAMTAASISSITNDGPRIRATGQITSTNWTCDYTVVYSHKYYVGEKSDDTGANTLNKSVDVYRITLTYTCTVAYIPTTIASGTTSVTNFDVFTLASSDNNFTSNVTISAGNQKTNWSAPVSTGTVTTHGASADLSALAVTTTILGSNGNQNGTAVLVDSLSTSGFGSQSVVNRWAADGSVNAHCQFAGTSAGASMPQGATITVTCWYVDAKTVNATTTGDCLLYDELVLLMQSLAGAAPTVSVGQVEQYVSGVSETLRQASARAVEGIQWFQSNANSLTTVSRNYGFRYNVKSAVLDAPDDDDGNMGEAYKLMGLCLRYLRTGDASLVTIIENQVQYHIDLEAAIVAARGSWWSGAASYWYWPSSSASSGKTSEGGVDAGDQDPGIAGAPTTINYTQGQPRAKTSYDQLVTVGAGLYHYLYLLRNSSAITANTTLRTNALSLLSRMKDFEDLHITANNRVLTNLYNICNGGSPSRANGINDTELNDAAATALANPYWGNVFGTWNVSDTDGGTPDPSANTACIAFWRALAATGSTVAGTKRFLQGQAMDMLVLDFGAHDVIQGGSVTTYGVMRPYPYGWQGRSNSSGNTTEFENPRTSSSLNGFSSDKHLLQCNATGARDTLNGRTAQRLGVLCLAALFDNTYAVPTEQNSTTTLRSVAITTLIDRIGTTLANYLPEPTTKANRYCVGGHLGESTAFDPQNIDSAMMGYWMWAVELWHLVKAGASYSTYYPVGSW